MNIFKFSVIAGSAIFGMTLAGCSSEDDVVPEIKPAKKAEVPAPVPEATVAASDANSMPELQSIESLSADASAAEGTFKTNGPVVQPSSEGAIVIQVSIQPSKSAANAVLKKLEEKGIKGYLAQVENPGELEGTYYRVRVGYFKKIEDAKAYGKSALEPLEFAWWIDNKANDTVGSPESSDVTNSNTTSGSYLNPEPMETTKYSTEVESSSSEIVESSSSEAAPVEAPAPVAEATAPAAEPVAEPTAPAPAPAAEAAPVQPAEEVYDDWE